MQNHSEWSPFGIDVAREKVLSFAEAARFVGNLKGTKRIAFQTLFRWATKGCRGVVLETVYVGGSRCTSVQALQRFFGRLTIVRAGGQTGAAAVSNTRPGSSARTLAVEPGDVDDLLRRAGIVAGDKEAA